MTMVAIRVVIVVLVVVLDSAARDVLIFNVLFEIFVVFDLK